MSDWRTTQFLNTAKYRSAEPPAHILEIIEKIEELGAELKDTEWYKNDYKTATTKSEDDKAEKTKRMKENDVKEGIINSNYSREELHGATVQITKITDGGTVFFTYENKKYGVYNYKKC